MRQMVLGVVIVLGACAAPQDTTADEAAIRAQTEALVNAMRAGDATAAAALFAPEGVMYPPNTGAVEGRAAITAWGQQMMSGMTMVGAGVSVDVVEVSGDLAVSQGLWGMTLAYGADTVTDTTAYLLSWRRADDGTWLITRDIWNSIRPQGN